MSSHRISKSSRAPLAASKELGREDEGKRNLRTVPKLTENKQNQ